MKTFRNFSTFILASVVIIGCGDIRVDKSGSYDSDTGTLNIQQIDKQSAKFDILVATERCTGEVNGKLVFITKNSAKFTDRSCHIKFIFGSTTVEVIENNCAEHHGMFCQFGGMYNKEKTASSSPSEQKGISSITGHYSTKTIHPVEGDCLGWDIWLNEESRSISGQLAAYEGDCNVEPVSIIDVKYERKTGRLEFNAPFYSPEYLWRFVGVLKNGKLTGELNTIQR